MLTARLVEDGEPAFQLWRVVDEERTNILPPPYFSWLYGTRRDTGQLSDDEGHVLTTPNWPALWPTELDDVKAVIVATGDMTPPTV